MLNKYFMLNKFRISTHTINVFDEIFLKTSKFAINLFTGFTYMMQNSTYTNNLLVKRAPSMLI